MTIDKIVLSKDRTWCYVYLVNREAIKVDFKSLNINYLDGLSMINTWANESDIVAA